MTGNKLRVGILVSPKMPAWAFYIIEQLQASDYADISLVIREDRPASYRQSQIYR